jgi:hypothetical protein
MSLTLEQTQKKLDALRAEFRAVEKQLTNPIQTFGEEPTLVQEVTAENIKINLKSIEMKIDAEEQNVAQGASLSDDFVDRINTELTELKAATIPTKEIVYSFEQNCEQLISDIDALISGFTEFPQTSSQADPAIVECEELLSCILNAKMQHAINPNKKNTLDSENNRTDELRKEYRRRGIIAAYNAKKEQVIHLWQRHNTCSKAYLYDKFLTLMNDGISPLWEKWIPADSKIIPEPARFYACMLAILKEWSIALDILELKPNLKHTGQASQYERLARFEGQRAFLENSLSELDALSPELRAECASIKQTINEQYRFLNDHNTLIPEDIITSISNQLIALNNVLKNVQAPHLQQVKKFEKEITNSLTSAPPVPEKFRNPEKRPDGYLFYGPPSGPKRNGFYDTKADLINGPKSTYIAQTHIKILADLKARRKATLQACLYSTSSMLDKCSKLPIRLTTGIVEEIKIIDDELRALSKLELPDLKPFENKINRLWVLVEKMRTESPNVSQVLAALPAIVASQMRSSPWEIFERKVREEELRFDAESSDLTLSPASKLPLPKFSTQGHDETKNHLPTLPKKSAQSDIVRQQTRALPEGFRCVT